MSHTRVKTTYETEGGFGSTEVHTLYCHHNHSCDCVTYKNEKGEVMSLAFCTQSDNGRQLWDAVLRLMDPFVDEWGKELKPGIEFYFRGPWEPEPEEKHNKGHFFDFEEKRFKKR